MDFSTWLNSCNTPSHWLFVKRLSANDTGLTGGHQVGIYLPKSLAQHILKPASRIDVKNPDMHLPATIDSHDMPEQIVRVVYYNSKKHENRQNGRDEQRITRWNTDVRFNPLQDPENTGALTLFSFSICHRSGNADQINVWICHGQEEESIFEMHTGEIIPGEFFAARADKLLNGFLPQHNASQTSLPLPSAWKAAFPSGRDIIRYLSSHFKFKTSDPDKLILHRRREEYKLFLEVEKHHVLDQIKNGFQTVDDFINLANSVGNRRKSRSGKSLEIHLEEIFKQQGLNHFGIQCKTEGCKTPDFLFPSCEAYHADGFPSEQLRMLAVKTTCKDRWRQILNEADKIKTKHLFTLQEGVSINQFNEMTAENVVLVVPRDLLTKYPLSIRDKILTLSDFIFTLKNQACTP